MHTQILPKTLLVIDSHADTTAPITSANRWKSRRNFRTAKLCDRFREFLTRQMLPSRESDGPFCSKSPVKYNGSYRLPTHRRSAHRKLVW